MSIYVVDETFVPQVNRGNIPLIDVVKRIMGSRNQVWMTNKTFRGLSDVDRLLVMQVGVQSPSFDNYVDRYHSRRMLDTIPYKAMTTAALAFHLKADIITTDRAFFDAWRKVHGNGESFAPVAGPVDYNQARRQFNLKPVTIAGDKIVPTERGPGTAPKVVAVQNGRGNPPTIAKEGPRSKDGARIMRNITARKAEKGEADTAEHGPNAVAAAKMEGRVLMLQGVNLLFKWVNGKINQNKFDAEWAQKESTVTAILNGDPSLGALIRAHFAPIGTAGEASQIEAPVQFRFIEISYGRTSHEALQNVPPRYEARLPGAFTDDQWKPPQQPLDVTKLPTPFKSVALATFVRGKEKLLQVGFRDRGGFHELRTKSDKKLDVPAGSVEPQFVVLYPPEKVQYFYFNHWNTKETDIDTINPSQIGELDYNNKPFPFMGLQVVELNSDTYGAMVYPADKTTERLFKSASPTNDTENLLAKYDLSLVRWVEPRNLHVLDVF